MYGPRFSCLTLRFKHYRLLALAVLPILEINLDISNNKDLSEWPYESVVLQTSIGDLGLTAGHNVNYSKADHHHECV